MDDRPRPLFNARGEPYQPGDLILDRYMPNASYEEREEARSNLRVYAEVVLRICRRLAEEERERANKREFDSP